ncbi:MAG: hypothetical protein JWO76_2857 [Nocardioides sp.]|nr:hypothetical protein [Nocardioides sp.]
MFAELQAAVAARDGEGVTRLFHEDAVLIGTSAYNSGPEAVHAYLRLVVEQPASLSWDLAEVDVFLEDGDLLGFAALGEVVLVEDGNEDRAPFRLTLVARRTPDGWRVLSFHGSIPSVP